MFHRFVGLLLVANLTVGVASAAVAATGPAGTFEAAAVQTAAGHNARTGSADFLLVNSSSQWLTLYIDGRGYGSVPPGDHQPALVSVGNHNFRVVVKDGSGRYLDRNNKYVGPGGVTWTVTDN